MKGRVTVVSLIDDLLELLEGRGFWLIEDWSHGLMVSKGNFDELKTKIQELSNRYNGNFKFKAFNEELEAIWDGEKGLLLQEREDGDYDVTQQKLMLEGDWRRFGGIRSLKGYKWAEVQFYVKKESICFIRFMKILEDKNE